MFSFNLFDLWSLGKSTRIGFLMDIVDLIYSVHRDGEVCLDKFHSSMPLSV